MHQILNPFVTIDPISLYLKFKKHISLIKKKEDLLEIGKMIEKRLKEFN